jgi:UDPglucose 6-dehydrogenase
MRVGIIGYGFVGKAIAHCYRGEDVVIRDPKLKKSAELSEFNNCDAIYVCVPSPSREDGSCDSTILEQTIHELLFVTVSQQIPIICKTTAPPSVYQRLLDQYPNIVHVPEFLTAANHIQDYINTEYIVVGGNKEWCERAIEILDYHLGISNDIIKIVDIKTAALYKYMMNSYLAAKVTFMNEFHKLASAQGVNWRDLTDIASYDNRIGMSHMNVPGTDGKYGWGGACFPKDMAAIINEAKSLDVDFKLLKQIQDINKEHRNNG